ncbi:MAG: WXG100 family type VII secretion target [Anaerolineae bacterium]
MEIRVHPDHLRAVASRLSHRTEEMDALMEEMLRAVGGLSAEWAGSAWDKYLDRFRTELPRMRELLQAIMSGLIRDLGRIADEFERTDRAVGTADRGTGVAAGTGTVLGAATVTLEALLADGGATSLSDRDRLALKMQIPRLLPQWEKERQAAQQGLSQTESALADLDRRIRDLQAQRDALQEQAHQWSNRILPDTERPGLGFDDGLIDAPWRTRSDALEDRIAEYDRQAQALREQQATLLRQRDELRARLDALRQRIDQARQMGPLTQNDVRRWVELDQGRPPGSEQCVRWARERSSSLHGPPLPPIGQYSTTDLGAHQYLKIFHGQTFQVPANSTDLTQINGLEAGACVVWNRYHPDTQHTAGYLHGHIAVIEAVQPDGVWISQSNWPGRPVMFIPRDRLSSLHVIPPGARPITPGEFARL